MSERYWITGCQLGLIRAWIESGALNLADILDMLYIIEEQQFIGNVPFGKNYIITIVEA